jgi:hypothetical protein
MRSRSPDSAKSLEKVGKVTLMVALSELPWNNPGSRFPTSVILLARHQRHGVLTPTGNLVIEKRESVRWSGRLDSQIHCENLSQSIGTAKDPDLRYLRHAFSRARKPWQSQDDFNGRYLRQSVSRNNACASAGETTLERDLHEGANIPRAIW